MVWARGIPVGEPPHPSQQPRVRRLRHESLLILVDLFLRFRQPVGDGERPRLHCMPRGV
ncbi:hypothetical protein ACQJBY_045918 [Aegilops geniculata]